MEEKLYIPKKINVGYNKRSDTYTGKLGYVIYWDDKGKLRKETSWESWRDKTLDSSVFDNEPTEGFVLNRKVGGVSGGHSWDQRIERVRVYDPRGFEFEISIPNLLYILTECTSSKGKGLEGQFVYSWAGKELVLLPLDTAEYKKSTGFTNLQAQKIGKDQMVPGCAYTFKDNEQYIYLGRLDFYTRDEVISPNPNFGERLYSSYSTDRDKYLIDYVKVNVEKVHVFCSTHNGHHKIESGFTKVARRDTETPVANLVDLVINYESTAIGGKAVEIFVEDAKLELKEGEQYSYCYLKEKVYIVKDNVYIPIDHLAKDYYNKTQELYSDPIQEYYAISILELDKYQNHRTRPGNKKYPWSIENQKQKMTIEEISNKYDFKKVFIILENGVKIDFSEYYRSTYKKHK